MIRPVYIDMDATGAIGNRACRLKRAYNILKVFDIFVLENRAYNLSGIRSVGFRACGANLALGVNAAV